MPNPITKVKTSDDVVHDLEVDLSDYYDKSETDLLLSAKADDADTYSKEEVRLALATKADVTNVYDKDAIDHLLGDKADKSNTYTEIEVDTLIDAKADKATTYSKSEIDSMSAAQSEVDSTQTANISSLSTAESETAGSLTSLSTAESELGSEYAEFKSETADRFADTYTITQTDALLDNKAGIDNSSITATMATWSTDKLNTEFGGKADTSNVYTKAEVDALIGGINIMPVLDFANPVFSFSSSNTTYTCVDDCYIFGGIGQHGTTADTCQYQLTIDSTIIAKSSISSSISKSSMGVIVPCTKLVAGQVVTLTSSQFNNLQLGLHIFKEVTV